MLILGIESSCDDTSVALVDCSEKGCFVVKEVTASQIEIHKKYGGVVPEVAGRMHAEKIVPLIEEVLNTPPLSPSNQEGDIAASKPDAIAVTSGPGLITGLIVGVEAAKTLSYVWDIPLIAVNHLWGHIHSVEILNSKPETLKVIEPNKDSSSASGLARNDNQTTKIQYPALALIVSGGHTELIFINEPGDYKKIGSTRDDAAGECFDKVAKLLDLPYPGGPQISKLAKMGDSTAIDFPRPMIYEKNLDFSFSGLKTSALYWLRDNKLADSVIASDHKERGNLWQTITRLLRRFTPRNDRPTTADFCASFEQAIVDVLVLKTLKAAKQFNPKTIILGGGVAANEKLRTLLSKESQSNGYELMAPNLRYCMDNAAMIAVAGYYQAQKKEFADWRTLQANPNWEIS